MPNEGNKPPRWGAYVAIELPEGTVRHPQVFTVIEEELDRLCIFNMRHAGVAVGFDLDAAERDVAQTECNETAARILQRLDLGHRALQLADVYERGIGEPALGKLILLDSYRPSPETR